ncbi:DUF1240 domain-containing protein [Providencia rettgeri]|nr:DUF1240 domain-containing protein [Providencia rettgeri]
MTLYRAIVYCRCSWRHFSGVPIAFAVNYYLKDEGYLTCDRISWMSPTTYVKNISLCD